MPTCLWTNIIKKDFIVHQQGFTLLELITVILISILLIFFAAPLTTAFLKGQEARRITDEIYQLCLYARAEAAFIKQPLSLCGSSDGHICDHNWAEGALLFIDKNRNRSINEGETVLKYSPFQISPSILKWKGFGGKVLQIEAVGIPFASNGSFTYCSADKDLYYRRQVVVSRSGRARHSPDANGDGIDEATDGNDINCE